VTALEFYLPQFQVLGFLAAWGLAMLTGLMFISALRS